MIIAIMQPTYMPWIGYFDLIDQVDSFVFFDDVKVLKRSWGVRNRIKTPQGELYLTVPLKKCLDQKESLFTNTEIAYIENWKTKHLKTISHTYSKSAYFRDVYNDLEYLLSHEYTCIGELNISVIRFFSEKCGIRTKLYCSSELPDISGAKDDRLVSICRSLGADKYLSPQGSAVYIEEKTAGGAFPEAEIELYYHNFVHPEYPQIGIPFLSYMSIIDLFMNCGYEDALDIIQLGRRENFHYLEFEKRMPQQHDSLNETKTDHAV